ncbi:hypothetical protein [Longispora albida]|uniref:hypothetical protein n=1 Tax=Longispora albida TaxID=203523 RepID=UPI000360A11A|nr:hypothetical protein [Longispora albida]
MHHIDDLLTQVMAVPGARGVSLVDYLAGQPVVAIGSTPGTSQASTAAGVSGLVGQPGQRGGTFEEIVVTCREGYHLFHCVPSQHAHYALYVWLDRRTSNLALCSRQVRGLVRSLPPAPGGTGRGRHRREPGRNLPREFLPPAPPGPPEEPSVDVLLRIRQALIRL